MINGKQFAKGKVLDGATIKDIAPTVTDILGVPKNPDWQGKSLL
jgi:bisphosphoglycerate-independent phosphoglycerate mutase (AlkP superfamily)